MKATVVSTIILLSGLSAMPAGAEDILKGLPGLACQAQLCLSAASAPAECQPSLKHYFGIEKPTWPATLVARETFLKLCPTTDAKADTPIPVAGKEAADAHQQALNGDAYTTHDQGIDDIKQQMQDLEDAYGVKMDYAGTNGLQGAYESRNQKVQNYMNREDPNDVLRWGDGAAAAAHEELTGSMGDDGQMPARAASWREPELTGDVNAAYASRHRQAKRSIHVSTGNELPDDYNYHEYRHSLAEYGKNPETGEVVFYGAVPHHTLGGPNGADALNDYEYDPRTGEVTASTDAPQDPGYGDYASGGGSHDTASGSFRRQNPTRGYDYYDDRSHGDRDVARHLPKSSDSGYNDYASAGNLDLGAPPPVGTIDGYDSYGSQIRDRANNLPGSPGINYSDIDYNDYGLGGVADYVDRADEAASGSSSYGQNSFDDYGYDPAADGIDFGP